MTGEDIAVILDTVLALERRKRQIAELRHNAADKTKRRERDEIGAQAARADDDAVQKRHRGSAHRAADAAGDSLMRGDGRGELLFAERTAAEVCARVAPKGDDERQKRAHAPDDPVMRDANERGVAIQQLRNGDRRFKLRDAKKRREHHRQHAAREHRDGDHFHTDLARRGKARHHLAREHKEEEQKNDRRHAQIEPAENGDRHGGKDGGYIQPLRRLPDGAAHKLKCHKAADDRNDHAEQPDGRKKHAQDKNGDAHERSQYSFFHALTPPNRRSRCRYSATASSMSFSEKSGQSTSVK